MGILETNEQFYNNLLHKKSPLFQFVGGYGKVVNDAIKGSVDMINKEKDKLEKKGPKGYVNEKVEQAKKVMHAVGNANQEMVKNPKETLKKTKDFIVNKAEEKWQKF